MEQVDLSYFCKTKAQALDFSARLSSVIDQMYSNTFSLEDALSDALGIQKKERFMKLLRENNVDTKKVASLKTFLTGINTTITTLPVLDITIAFEPKEKNLQAILDWFSITLKKQILLNVLIDPAIIGGAKINFKGKYIDASIKPVFEKLLSDYE